MATVFQILAMTQPLMEMEMEMGTLKLGKTTQSLLETERTTLKLEKMTQSLLEMETTTLKLGKAIQSLLETDDTTEAEEGDSVTIEDRQQH